MTSRRCCDGPCEYRVEVVEHHLNTLAAFQAAGEDPSRAGRGRPLDREIAGRGVGNGDLDLLDIQAAVQALRAEGKPVTAVTVSERLCPWSVSYRDIDDVRHHVP